MHLTIVQQDILNIDHVFLDTQYFVNILANEIFYCLSIHFILNFNSNFNISIQIPGMFCLALQENSIQTRQSEMADLARRATSVCTKFHRDRLRND